MLGFSAVSSFFLSASALVVSLFLRIRREGLVNVVKCNGEVLHRRVKEEGREDRSLRSTSRRRRYDRAPPIAMILCCPLSRYTGGGKRKFVVG